MKRILILFMLFSVTMTVSAQRGNRSMDPKTRAKNEVETIKDRLKLNEKQEKQCYNAHLEHYKRHQEIFNKNYSREKLGEEIQKERKIFHKRLQGIFTKEQHVMYMKIRKERKEKMKEQRIGRRKGRRGAGY